MNTYEIESLSAMKAGTVTLCIGSSTGANVSGALRVAYDIAHTLGRGKVLYINTVQTKRQLAGAIKRIKLPEKNENAIEYLTSSAGELSGLKEFVLTSLSGGAKFIIINSLEFSSKDYRRRDELIFQILQWTNVFGAGVLVFSEGTKNAPRMGRIQRGGAAGKLAALARSIVFAIQPDDEFAQLADDDSESDDEDAVISDIADQAHYDKAMEDWQDWKPANVDEEVSICTAYKTNHPEFKKLEGESWFSERKRIVGLINEEKKKRAIQSGKIIQRSGGAEQAGISPDGAIVYSPDKPPAPAPQTVRESGAREKLL